MKVDFWDERKNDDERAGEAKNLKRTGKRSSRKGASENQVKYYSDSGVSELPRFHYTIRQHD